MWRLFFHFDKRDEKHWGGWGEITYWCKVNFATICVCFLNFTPHENRAWLKYSCVFSTSRHDAAAKLTVCTQAVALEMKHHSQQFLRLEIWKVWCVSVFWNISRYIFTFYSSYSYLFCLVKKFKFSHFTWEVSVTISFQVLPQILSCIWAWALTRCCGKKLISKALLDETTQSGLCAYCAQYREIVRQSVMKKFHTKSSDR